MRRRRAIVFDDEPSVLGLLDAALTRRGYEVMAFNEPVICPIYENNASICDNEYPCSDVIITDFKMPRMNGIELLKRQQDCGCRLPGGNKALISAYLDEDALRAAGKIGCALINKPFRMAELSQWLDECEKRVDLSVPLGIRRKEKRTSAKMAMHYRVDSWGQVMTGIATDISPSGLCMKTGHNFLREQMIRIVSSLPNACTTGYARWSKRMDDGLYLTGFSCC